MSACPVAGATVLKGKVIKVIDGDSLLVHAGRESVAVRLWGIDAPEHDQPYGKRATQHCRSLVDDREVTIQVKGRDDYGRLIGVVQVNRLNVNEELVRMGSAWVYKKYCRSSICRDWQKLEQSARQGQRGLWKNPRVVPPWSWRHS